MYIAIAGNIGSGKTTLTEILTKRYNAKAYYEALANPYINDFYDDMSRWSFHLQLWFLGSRIEQTLDMLADNSEHVFQDRTIYEDAHIFADNLHKMGLMSSRDFDTYMKIFAIQCDTIPKPTLISQIRMRGRDYEQNIDEEYLCRLNDKYNNWIDNIYDGRVLVVNKDVDDFVKDPSIIDRICNSLEEMCMRKREL